MRTGPDIDAIRGFAKAVNVPVTAAGGISSVRDIEDLLPLEEDGLRGIIIGRALYDGSIRLENIDDVMRGDS